MTISIQDVLPVLAQLERHRDQQLPMRDLAARAGLSPVHFQHAFARRVGESPTAYAARIRLELAAAGVKQ